MPGGTLLVNLHVTTYPAQTGQPLVTPQMVGRLSYYLIGPRIFTVSLLQLGDASEVT